MKSLIAIALLTSIVIPGSVHLAANGVPTRLLRTPSISATHVAFAIVAGTVVPALRAP